MNDIQIQKYLAEVLKEKDIFLRAEDNWIDWEDFKGKRSHEDLKNLDKDSFENMIDDIEKGMYKNQYDIYGCEKSPEEMIAKGVNAIKVSAKNFCNAVGFVEMIGYDDDEFVFVLFRGKNIGKNLYGDGNIVIPEKLLKIFLPRELFRFCNNKR